MTEAEIRADERARIAERLEARATSEDITADCKRAKVSSGHNSLDTWEYERHDYAADVLREVARTLSEAGTPSDAVLMRVALAVLNDRGLCEAHFRSGPGTPTASQARAIEERDRLLASIIATAKGGA